MEILTSAIVDTLNVYPGEITEETTFLGDLGADSLDVYQIVMAVEEELGITLDNEAIKEVKNVKEAVELIKKAEADQ